MRHTRQTLVCVALVLVSGYGSAQETALADRVLPWLPADTEVLYVAAEPFRVADPNGPAYLTAIYPMMAISVFPDESVASVTWHAVAARTILGAVYVGRNWHKDRMMGGALDNCSILNLQDDVLARVLVSIERLPTVNLAGIAVRKLLYSRGRARTETVVYLAVLAPNLLAACSEPTLLRAILDRKQQSARRAALPSSLPEWEWIDRKAAVWGIRHFSASTKDETSPKSSDGSISDGYVDPKAIGIGFHLQPNNHAIFTHVSGSKTALGTYRRFWDFQLPKEFSEPRETILRIDCDIRLDMAAEVSTRVLVTLLGYMIVI